MSFGKNSNFSCPTANDRNLWCPIVNFANKLVYDNAVTIKIYRYMVEIIGVLKGLYLALHALAMI